MTLLQLHRRLGKLIEAGNGRLQVAVNKDTFRDNCESDGCVILRVEGLGVQRVLQSDEDGGVRINKDGTEASRLTVVLVGASGATAKGEIVNDP